jgi:zinc protease
MHIKQWFIILLGLCSLQTFAAVPIQHWQTSQGGRVYFVKSTGLPMLDMRLVFAAGSARDGQQQGLAALTTRLMETGAGHWSAGQLAQQFEDVGARFSYDLNQDYAWLGLRTLTQADLFKQALSAFQQVVTQPGFAKDEFQRIKDQVQIELQQQQEQPNFIVKKTFYQALYGQHPYAHLKEGTQQSVAAITLADVQRFYRQYYVAQNAILVLVGDISKAQAEQLAENLFAKLGQGQKAPALPKVPALQAGKTQHIDFSSTQTHVLAGLPALTRTDADYFPLYVGNYILGGGGLVSRLFYEVREKRGLAYSAYSYFSPLAEAGPFTLGLQTQNKQSDLAIAVLKQTLYEFIQKGPSQQELEAAKKNLTGGFVLRFDNNSKLLNYIVMIAFYQLPLDYLDTFQTQVAKVTLAQIREAFQHRVNPKLLQVISVGGKE